MSTVPRARVQRPLFAIVIAAVALVVARGIWPGLNFDSTSLVLFAIAAAAWALAYLPISRFKAGDYEIELVQTVTELKQKVSKIETADRVTAELEQKVIASEVREPSRRHTEPPVVMRGEPRSDPDTTRHSSEIAREYRMVVASAVPDREKITRVVALVERLARDGGSSAPLPEAVDALRNIRDNITAGRYEATPRLVNSVLELAWRLIKAAG